MNLKSSSMQLTSKERAWLPWFGENGKLSLGRSCYLNKSIYPVIEQTFEGIAATRVQLLKVWANSQWDHLGAIKSILVQYESSGLKYCLNSKCNELADFSELFVIDDKGYILASSYEPRIGKIHDQHSAIKQATNSKRFLHGPYIDRDTLNIGPSSSKFHDEVTLMFYLPIELANQSSLFLCGRVPNDVLGDIIQREAGHIYSESGDNYLFMVDAKFDPNIQYRYSLVSLTI
ncbi:hypothetical protein RS130_11195 [Paraglaciecola aquimarina]|uniref:Uncharacterized protein n=1 Tax=Paraglaciecola aquimarina TaxID=1235557 RepID=A0ABU3SWM9_9ALTE|nr:hypothetical protein [Paraglaciecola aquimarina]MDU0354421.1 hypothetical protein [Paraglaciecola aquimarina]